MNFDELKESIKEAEDYQVKLTCPHKFDNKVCVNCGLSYTSAVSLPIWFPYIIEDIQVIVEKLVTEANLMKKKYDEDLKTGKKGWWN
jgi:hypothetical protein